MKIRNNDGFTLVELLVTIVVASIVAAAAGTVLLMGIRLNANSTNTAQRQNTTRVFLSVMEDLASEGSVDKVVSKENYWYVAENQTPAGSDEYVEKILLYYTSEAGAICSGGALQADGTCKDGTPLLEGVLSSKVEQKNNLLTVEIKTIDGIYSTSVYCKEGVALAINQDELQEIVGNPVEELELSEIYGRTARAEFLKALLSQLGSHGQIFGAEEGQPGFFSSWYSLGWPTDTPWCACYISWALAEVKTQCFEESVEPPKYANVDDFVAFFETKDNQNSDENKGYQWVSFNPNDLSDGEGFPPNPNPGDIIFMDWTRQQKDAAHVGVVLAVKGGYIYTIEGNTANMVAVRKYPVGDPVLMGYGVIDWKPDA